MRSKPVSGREDEVSRWLTLERIGRSELVKWALFENRDAWRESQDDMGEWLISTIRLFACGGCYDLANAVALETGAPIAVIKRQGDRKNLIAHAVVFEAATGCGADILGRRLISEIVSEFRYAVGPIRLELIEGDAAEFGSDAEREAFAEMASALPWMPRNDRRRVAPFSAFRDQVAALAASGQPISVCRG